MSSATAYVANYNRIRAFADATNSRDDVALEHAARNLTNGQPAFWVAASYHNQGAGNLRYYVNVTAGVLPGIRAVAADYPDRAWLTLKMLDQLVPFNDAAVDDLAEAYGEVDSFCPREELRHRLLRIELNASAKVA